MSARESLPPSRGGAEHLLLDAARRAMRAPEGWLALVLHLGRLAPPAPQPHHRRVARALLHEAAERHHGQLFPLANGDLVLLCRRAETTGEAGPWSGRRAQDPLLLPEALARLFGAQTADQEEIVSLWRLAVEADSFFAYAAGRLDAAGPPARQEAGPANDPEPVPPAEPLLDGFKALAATPGFAELVQRQTAALIVRAGGGKTSRLRPLFREIGFRLPALAARLPEAGEARADPYLFRHFARHLDRQMLAIIEAAWLREGPPGEALAMRGGRDALALHLNLTLETVLGSTFAHFARLCRAVALPVGVEVSLIEAVADGEAFARARAVLEPLGFALVLDGVSHLALALCRPQALAPDLLKLEWSQHLPGLGGAEQRAFAASLAALGPERVVLQRAETEAAVLWGLAHGIRRFQGRHVDAMLGAARMAVCPAAAGCTLSQCAERAGAATAPGRLLCRNLALLDAGAPKEGARGEPVA
ncbi:MAG TPA: hypothetical protein VMF62_07390 [Acetobacteraceae bacterium]|nr:hypothetical protein [Acetobacteraceae bacterium]